MEDVIKQLVAEGYKPKLNEDGFEPITGKYVCRIDSAGRVQGTSERTKEAYDFYSINPQVVEVVDGDKATNRFLKMTYHNTPGGLKKLLNDLFTAGLNGSFSDQGEMDAYLISLKDQTMNIRAWVWTPDKDMQGNVLPEEQRVPRQMLKVVKQFKGGSSVLAKSEVPF